MNRAYAIFDFNGNITIGFPFDHNFIAWLKARVPVHARDYRPKAKTWWVAPDHAQEVVEYMRAIWPDVLIVDLPTRSIDKPARTP